MTGIEDDEAEGGQSLKALTEYVMKQLESTTVNKATASVDITVVDRAISGWVAISMCSIH